MTALHRYAAASNPLAWRPLQRSTRLAILLALIATLFYLLFLIKPSNRGEPWLWALTLAAEGLTAFHALGTWWTILAHDDRPEPVDVVVRRNDLRRGAVATPSVDVFITAYGEPDDLVMRTATAARDMLLEHETWVLDDGRSDTLAARCAEENIRYLRRDGRQDAKAGNINAALAKTQGEFVLVLDADHVPTREFLVEVIPHFVDPTVALVQAPQSYVERRGLVPTGAAEAQRIFYELVCPGKNHFNAAFCVGTNVVFRRAALDQVGGIHTGSNSEDIWTSLDLHRMGWRSVYVPQVLARGLAPDDLGAFVKQQHRWASGGFEVLLRGGLFRRDRRLTLDQRLQYMFVGTHYLLSLAMLVFMCLPATFLMFGLSPIQAGGWAWATHYIPFMVMTLAVTWLQSGGFRLAAVVTSIAAAPAHVRAIAAVALRRKTRWAATNATTRSGASMWPVMPHVALIALNCCAIVVGLSAMTDPAPTYLSIAWASMHIVFLGRLVGEAVLGSPSSLPGELENAADRPARPAPWQPVEELA